MNTTFLEGRLDLISKYQVTELLEHALLQDLSWHEDRTTVEVYCP